MGGLLNFLTFFSTSFGLMVVGMVAAAMILFWEWRLALAGLFVVQVGVATVAVQVEKVPAEWAGVMTAVTALTCLILALSAQQVPKPVSLRQSGSFLLRAMVLVLIFLAWRAMSGSIRIPELVPQITALFVWLGLCVLVMLALSDNPLFYAVALLLWCVPAQAVAGVLLGIPALIALIGMIELVIALACSYLVLTDQLPVVEQRPVLTDITFPDLIQPEAPVLVPPSADMDWLNDLARGWWGRLRRGAPVFRRPGSMRPDQTRGRAIPARKQP
jgi:hypothetical protein